MKVLKFGGTSVGSPANIEKVRDIILSNQGTPLAVVVSAFSGVTNQLESLSKLASAQDPQYRDLFTSLDKKHLEMVRSLIPLQQQSGVISQVKIKLQQLETLLEGAFLIAECTPRLKDRILGFGEQLSATIISSYLQHQGINARFTDSTALIRTNTNFGNATVNMEVTFDQCREVFGAHMDTVHIIPGFTGASAEGHLTTLGRGGSDYSASLIAAALKAELLEIWTDVSGMYTADPRWVKQARPIPEISYEEAMELSHFGAKVVYPPSIQPALEERITIRVCNTMKPQDPGTVIKQSAHPNKRAVRGISHIGSISLLSLEGPGMVGVPGISQRLFGVLSHAGINVIMITQASSEHSICVAVSDAEAENASLQLRSEFAAEIATHKIAPPKAESGMSIIALVGDQMKSYQGLSGRMFSTLGKNNVNIRAIAQGASERNISAVIAQNDVKKALNTLHEAFFEEDVKQINLYVMGAGNVGKRFLEQIRAQQKYLRNELRIQIRLCGLANSRTMVFDPDGIDLQQWEVLLPQGEKSTPEAFHQKVMELNLRNSVFVDITANKDIAFTYAQYLSKSVAVVTCNKIAASSEFEHYRELKKLASRYNTPFLFETNVGAGLPVVDTLKNLVISGDKVQRIEAVLSGSLNFIFNNFQEGVSFAQIVQQAMDEGYTEPDPRIDLSGVDVMRKILILARESGKVMELENIDNRDFLPDGALQTESVEAFLNSLNNNEEHFKELLKEASHKGSRLKYVASMNGDKASVGLQFIAPDHPFYHLEGKDNIVLFYTDRYPDQPLNIKGAGAGADVTASGIFADIIRTAST